ncbi:uncharacterized protein LOC122819728 isoform X2 [Gambusia affinis]|uniref:uncharacterized protein LOC122819728 isoform X2 n=1 Tax=Gambusia affinis TaxID=33528 RepID=UPI001CDBFD13|nr:uncharacterized protein LOC122819728 isoform X2 [Gambusia affinis]
MDPHRIYSSVCAVMVCLLGATRLSSGENCKCPAIPPKDLTVRTDRCFQINSVYRYQCIPGYTRKPGTSNLIKCQEKNGVLQWTESLFKCITDPNYQPLPATTTENCKCPAIPPKDLTVRTDECFQNNSVYRYQCIPGYTRKPGTSNLIKCQEKNGVLQWTESLFKCITDPNYPSSTATTTGPSSTLQSVRTSTSDPAASPNTEPSALGGERMTVCISLIGVILFFIVCGVIFFLYRQRNKPIPPRDLEELEAMKC